METTFKLSKTRSLIIYDLVENDVSADDIVSHTDKLFTAIRFSDISVFNFPESTIKADLNVADAKKVFFEALKASGSNSEIKKLVIIEITDANGYIFEKED